jgi:hypothetical protein
MVTKRQLNKYGKEEAEEHHMSLRAGKKTALDHISKYGPKYYPAIEKVEKRLLNQQKKSRRK